MNTQMNKWTLPCNLHDQMFYKLRVLPAPVNKHGRHWLHHKTAFSRALILFSILFFIPFLSKFLNKLTFEIKPALLQKSVNRLTEKAKTPERNGGTRGTRTSDAKDYCHKFN